MYRAFISFLLIFFKDPETIHHFALLFLKFLGLPGVRHITEAVSRVRDERLVHTVFGIRFENPVGIAAGFDKEAQVLPGLEALGFGYVEVGTVTRFAQEGNPRPRIFRFESEKAIINRMGFNNTGSERMAERLIGRSSSMPLGISLGKSKITELEDAAEDYRFSYQRLYELGDYFVINVSSPNTPGLRQLQDRKFLVDIVTKLNEYRDLQKTRKPLLVKIAPDLAFEAIDEVLEVCRELKIDGIIATNTTVGRRGVSEEAAAIAGGLSGEPVRKMSTNIIRHIHGKAPHLPIIGVGGIFTAEDAYEKIRAGASLVQVYTGFIYEGPGLGATLNSDLLKLLEKDGYKNISEAVGTLP